MCRNDVWNECVRVWFMHCQNVPHLPLQGVGMAVGAKLRSIGQ